CSGRTTVLWMASSLTAGRPSRRARKAAETLGGPSSARDRLGAPLHCEEARGPSRSIARDGSTRPASGRASSDPLARSGWRREKRALYRHVGHASKENLAKRTALSTIGARRGSSGI